MSNQRVTGELPSAEAKISEAATWLCAHRDECVGRIVPTLRARFGLRASDAIEAAKRAHALQYGGASHG
jgi:hypothetical protein